MGWLWQSTTPAPAQEKSQAPSNTHNDLPAITPAAPPPPKPLTRDELAEKDLQSFLQEIAADTHPSSSKYSRVPQSSSSPPQTTSPNAPSNEPLSEQLLPETMSCRDAFDAAFYCNSMGGQFNNLYRYGTVRACSENWNDFWFCMRVRTSSGEVKTAAIREHYRKKEKIKYGKEGKEGQEEIGNSSEDVWRTRDRKLEWGEAFGKSFPDFAGNDQEWNEAERERRRVRKETLESGGV